MCHHHFGSHHVTSDKIAYDEFLDDAIRNSEVRSLLPEVASTDELIWAHLKDNNRALMEILTLVMGDCLDTTNVAYSALFSGLQHNVKFRVLVVQWLGVVYYVGRVN